MTDATQTATTTDARQASMSRVQTQESVLAKLAPPTDATDQASDTSTEAKDGEKQNDGETKPKQSAQERIRELARQRREAEAKAEDAERRVRELEARLNAQAPELKDEPRPVRHNFASQEEYEDAVGEWKAKQIIRQREQEQAQARAQAEQQEIAATWEKNLASAMERIEDYADVVGKSEVNVPAHVHQMILESDQGPEIAYYLALHPDEAKRLGSLRPLQAVKRMAELERELKDLADDKPSGKSGDKPGDGKKVSRAPQKSKAPPPVDPVRSAPSGTTAQSGGLKDYKARRQAEQKKA